MDIEVSKIRKKRNLDDVLYDEPERIKMDKMSNIIVELNMNMANLYNKRYHEDIDIIEFINDFIKNMYIVISTFNDMGLYPDYFYNEIVKMNIDYQKMANANTTRGEYEIYRRSNLRLETIEKIKEGLKEKIYTKESNLSIDVSDAYEGLSIFFKVFSIPHGIMNKEYIIKAFDDIYLNITAIMNSLSVSDDLFDDVLCLSRLLFEYISFFVLIGVNPKEYLDEYIDNLENHKTL